MASSKMSSSNRTKEDVEDLFHCGICDCLFNNVERKPKFLPCSHTLCLSCANQIFQIHTPFLVCPFCRKPTEIKAGDVKDLPNNQYALEFYHLLPLLDIREKKKPQWCLTCKKEATKFCRLMPGDHSTILMESASPRECRDLQKKMSINADHLMNIVQKRKDAKYGFKHLSSALKDALREIEKEDDENESRLDRIMSHLGSAGLNIDTDETAQSLLVKVEESSELIKEELVDIQELEGNYLDHLKKTIKVSVQFKDQSGEILPLFQPKMKIPKMISDEEFKQISFQSYLFQLEFTQGSRKLGSIMIKPDEAFYRPFMTSLARFCHGSPMVFGSSIVKAFPTSFAIIGFNHPDFNQAVPDPASFEEDSSIYNVDDKLDVGFIDSSYDGNAINEFQLVFLIRPFNENRMKNCSLFGEIVEGSDVVDILSRKPSKERGGLNVSIQFLQYDD